MKPSATVATRRKSKPVKSQPEVSHFAEPTNSPITEFNNNNNNSLNLPFSPAVSFAYLDQMMQMSFMLKSIMEPRNQTGFLDQVGKHLDRFRREMEPRTLISGGRNFADRLFACPGRQWTSPPDRNTTTEVVIATGFEDNDTNQSGGGGGGQAEEARRTLFPLSTASQLSHSYPKYYHHYYHYYRLFLQYFQPQQQQQQPASTTAQQN